MPEYLALPAWNTPPTTVDAWVVGLAEAGGPVVVRRESPTVAWLEAAPLRLRGYVMIEDGHATAINFEVHDPDPGGPANRAVEAAAAALGWEVHPDDGEDEAEDDDD